MAVVIFTLLGVGIYMTEFLDHEATNRIEIYNLHKSFGVLALILIFSRIVNRLIYKAPKQLETLKIWEQKAAHFVHILLYILMLIAPISGYLMSNLYGYPVKFFGIQLPFLVSKNAELGHVFSEIHEISTFGLLAIVVIHVGAVIKHKFFDKKENDVLKRML